MSDRFRVCKKFEEFLQEVAGGDINLLAILFLQEKLGCGEAELIARYFDTNGNTAWIQALSRHLFKTTVGSVQVAKDQLAFELKKVLEY